MQLCILRIFINCLTDNQNILTCTYLFKKNGTLYFSNKIKIINHNDLILLGIHIHPWPHVSYKCGSDIQRNKDIATIIVKEAKTV